MPPHADQIVTVAQMRGAEQALIDAGSSVEALMDQAGRGAAEWIWRLAAGRRVTVLCGPGNNGGDGWVIAQTLHERGGAVAVVMAAEPRTKAAKAARALYQGEVLSPEAEVEGDVFVDCLFGSGLSRPLDDANWTLLRRLARSHRLRVAVDLPSGIAADSGELLNVIVPRFDVTIALGAWKFAHLLMPASFYCGALRLVDIGIAAVPGAARMLPRPSIVAPHPRAHKYTRGLLAVVGGAMPGAAVLAATAAQGAGAGYVKLLGGEGVSTGADLVHDTTPLDDALYDHRIAAILVGPGLGRDAMACERLATVLTCAVATVLDADALHLLEPRQIFEYREQLIATPHEGELGTLERTFGCAGTGTKPERALALALASGMVIVAKGPDTVIAAPDGRLACAPRASSWLSVAGSGDVLAGAIASRLAYGSEAFDAACEGVWLQAEAARRAGAAFTASALAAHMPCALAACL